MSTSGRRDRKKADQPQLSTLAQKLIPDYPSDAPPLCFTFVVTFIDDSCIPIPFRADSSSKSYDFCIWFLGEMWANNVQYAELKDEGSHTMMTYVPRTGWSFPKPLASL